MSLQSTDPEYTQRLGAFLEEVKNEPGSMLEPTTRWLAILAQREMITFCFLSAQGGCEPQLIAHAKGNINMGNDAAFLTKVVLQCLPYIGYPRSLNAMDCIAKAAKQ